MSKKKIIGILGGIGSGKSTIAGMFKELGCKVIDADAIAHTILDRPEVLSELADCWGTSILNAEGGADRKRIAEIVFNSPSKLDFLNQRVHPRVLEQTAQIIDACQADPDIAAIVLDMPLLLEVGWEKKCDFLIFVECSEEKRRARIAKNAKIDAEQLKNREKFQISLDKKKEKAHYKVHNNSDKSDVAEQIAQIFSSITANK